MTSIDSDKYGPWAVIAGGSEGVGAVFADELAMAGLNLVLIARKEDALEATAEQARRHGTEVRTLVQDLLAPDAVANIAAATADLEVGLLIFNAGANTYGNEFVFGDMERFRSVMTLNIDRQLDLVQMFGRPMAERGHGGIVLLGSVTGFVGSGHQSIYSAAKAFSRVFAEGLWWELRDYGVDVVELVLGVTRTPAMARAGLNFDAPGLLVSEPADVAREGLAHIGDGPVWVIDAEKEGAVARSQFPRDQCVRAEAHAVAAMMGR
ncbi:SDR family NAD(P)-dependent oxidoreductase [Gordonia sp. HY285]|uniref:SDR family NAD(P)-dependent oxidoreductase n=1 Tax=Gordonia liuliyuniae TaxID=2911517 RepID=UPI001F1C051E|nr:SDR family NAD(P)-dependent oxidoreductase [Gordonia liuliyuniae]MCF8610430.1 SDR family NAD(P)-dependent oxidoreductase [Gordonia liuliyuniae]